MTAMKTDMTSQNSLLTILRSRFVPILVALTLGAFALASVPTAFGKLFRHPTEAIPAAIPPKGILRVLAKQAARAIPLLEFNALGDNTTGQQEHGHRSSGPRCKHHR